MGSTNKPVAERRAEETADTDALAMAYLLSIVEVLLKEAIAQRNVPRVERLIKIADIAEEARKRAVARKEGL